MYPIAVLFLYILLCIIFAWRLGNLPETVVLWVTIVPRLNVELLMPA